MMRSAPIALLLGLILGVGWMVPQRTLARPEEASDTAHPAAVPATSLGIQYVVVVVMENRGYDAIVGSPNAPYLNRLIQQYGLATNFTAVGHPSQPNYLALLGGSTFGITDDGIHDLRSSNLIDQLEARGLSWRIAAENVPTGCFRGAIAFGGPDGPGRYARKHEPAISFTDISRSPARCRKIQNLSSFKAGAANVHFVIPNTCHDMHDCSTANGDAFLENWLPGILTSPTFGQTLLVVTWDEGSDDLGGGGHVATLVISPTVHPGARAASRMSTYSIPRTIEDLWGLGCLRYACSARSLLSFLPAH
jgi:acid phosphatase